MATPRKKKTSRVGTQQTNKYSFILGDRLRLVSKSNSNTKETRSNNGYILTGGRRSSDKNTSEILSMWKSLSAREKDVTVLVCEGFTNEQIAYNLGISVASVKTYLRFV